MKALIFDLDGTLIDSVYAQVLAWQKSLDRLEHLAVPAWRLHEKIGLDGTLLAPAIARAGPEPGISGSHGPRSAT